MKVVKVKKSDKGDFYKRQQTWELRDLTEVDAKDASKVRTMTCLYFVTFDLSVLGLLQAEGAASRPLQKVFFYLLHHANLFPFPGLKPNLLYAKFQQV